MTPRLVQGYRRAQDLVLPERWAVRRFIARHLAVRAPTGDGICLDLGGGNAPFAGALAAAWPGARQLVMDTTPGDRTSVVADAQALPLGDGRARVVAMFQVIQHLVDPAGALRECRRVLEPGGLLLLTYPFLFGEGRSRDLRRWTVPGIEGELHAAGFEPVAHATLGGPCFLVTSLLADLPGRLLIVHREGWRSGRGPGDVLWLATAFAASLPFHLLGFPALLLDRAIARPAHYVGGVVLARRRDDG